ncbi:MAG: hypothetical protein HZY73_06910 [Micropruina sp.]|nr:MAG: hypothetical protein HZY73_06910 [Micropruina sp.]
MAAPTGDPDCAAGSRRVPGRDAAARSSGVRAAARAGVLVAILGAFQLLLGQPGMAAVVAGNVVLAVYAARLITLTTPASELVDAVVRAAARIPS